VDTTPCPDSRELDLAMRFKNPYATFAYQLVRRPFEAFLRFDQLRSVYRNSCGPFTGGAFLERVLDAADIQVEIGEGDLDNIPPRGPVVLVSNHPYGVVDPMAVLSMVLTIRPDARILGNRLLWRIPEIRDLLIPVDAFGGDESARGNMGAMRQCLRHLKKGGALCVCPAGTVSHLHLRKGTFAVADPAWNPAAMRLAGMCSAPVVPVHVTGRNSRLFQLAGLVHPLLRTALLPRENVNRFNRPIRIRIGPLIPCARLERFSSAEERCDYLRSRTYLLADDRKTRMLFLSKSRNGTPLEPIAPALPVERSQREVAALDSDRILVAKGRFMVCCIRASETPDLFREIARLREVTFRQEGEGTGKALDRDHFDLAYRHLVLWDRQAERVAGAYRMGLSEEILPGCGARGLYTHTLFHYGRRFLERITPAIELGRSFILKDYQKSYQPLFLLWKGLAAFVFRHPEYRNLFGPVSISQAYRGRSRELMAAFLKENNRVTELSRFVRPRKPFRRNLRRDPELRMAVDSLTDIRELSELVADLEYDRKGIPVLIRQYLRLGGVVLGLNVDPAFQNALDALVFVDLTRTPERTLARYMGREQCETFLGLHRQRVAECA
jgi:putative hemolysin